EPYKLKAEASQKICRDLYDQLEKYKQQIVKEAGGYDKESGQLLRNDDIDVATRIFVEEGQGKKLKDLILQSRNQLLALPSDVDKSAFASSIPLLIEEPKDGQS